MGYSLLIGERVFDEEYYREMLRDDPDLDLTEYCFYHVLPKKLEEAPAFPGDDLSQHGNDRHPSYSGWAEFCDDVGLADLFFDRENGCLIQEHSGVMRLERQHYYAVRVARKRYQAQYPQAMPEVGPYDYRTGFDKQETCNYNLIRLLWLEWWMKWALENCKEPSFYNS